MRHFHLFPLKLIQRSYRINLRLDFCGHRTSSVVWDNKLLQSSSHLIVVSLPSYSCESFYAIRYHKSRVVRFQKCSLCFGFVLDHAPPLGGGLDISRSWNIIHVMTCRIACSFFIHSNQPWSCRPSSSFSEVERCCHFPSKKIFRCQWSTDPQSSSVK